MRMVAATTPPFCSQRTMRFSNDVGKACVMKASRIIAKTYL